MKRPFFVLVDMFYENLEKTKEDTLRNLENLDKLIVWIVGFSIGGLSIIILNLTEFNQNFNSDVLKNVLLLLTISVISGVLYKVFFFYFLANYQEIQFFLKSAFNSNRRIVIDTERIEGENDIESIIEAIKEDFGEDILSDKPEFLKLYSEANAEGKDFFLNDMINHYKKHAKWAKGDYEFGLGYIKDTYKTAFGFSQRKIDKLFKEQNSTKFKLLKLGADITLISSTMSFIAVLVILCYSFRKI